MLINNKFSAGIIVIFMLFLLFSCNKTTSVSKGTLVGVVTLSGMQGSVDDHSGITVALYHISEVDSLRARIATTYQGLGSSIPYFKEFDHRVESMLASTTTDVQGRFLLNEVPFGRYNVVIFKQGWDILYFYDMLIDKEESDLNSMLVQKGQIELHPVFSIGGFITEPYIFRSGATYLIENNASFIQSVTLEAGTRIYVSQGAMVNIHSLFTISNGLSEPIYISSNQYIYSTTKREPADIARFSALNIRETASVTGGVIEGLLLSFSTDGLYLDVDGIQIKNSTFLNCSSGVIANNRSNMTTENVSFVDCGATESAGLNLNTCSNIEIQESIYLNNTIGIKQHTCTESIIQNCYFQGNTQSDVMNLYETIADVTHCEFRNSNVAIDTSGRSRTTVTYCNINAKIGIFNYIQLNWFASWFTANYNNFYCTEYAAKTRAVFYSSSPTHLDAKNNYWNTSSSTAIADMIWDLNDEDPNDPDYYILMGVIDYTPFRTAKVQNAGISP